jgi:hypothetical protein
MKKLFCKWTVGAILVAMLTVSGLVEQIRAEDREQKQKVRIVVADKKERDTSGNGNQSQKPESRNKKS